MFPQSLNISLTDPQILDYIKMGYSDKKYYSDKRYDHADIYRKIVDFNFHDIAMINVICRPSDYEFHYKNYIKNRKCISENKEIIHVLPDFSDITKDTCGLLLYWQQIESIISRITKCDETLARKIRKSYGKRKMIDIEAYEKYIFIEGEKNGFCKELIKKTIEVISNHFFYWINREYAYYTAFNIYMDGFYNIYFKEMADYYKDNQHEMTIEMIDLKNDYYTFKNRIVEHFVRFYALQNRNFLSKGCRTC